MFRKNRIDIISMGCSKNLVDSERLIKQLAAKGYDTFHDDESPCGEYVVVNTCGFINDAKEESVNTILSLARLKDNGKIGTLVVMGCLSQRYMDELREEIPEVDKWYGKFDWKKFIEELPHKSSQRGTIRKWERCITTPAHHAYLKISEGCNRFCAFCAIPLITGRHVSRPIEEILDETRQLVSEGVKEFNVIAQDLSSYGIDLYGKHALAELIDAMACIPGVEWIRLHYAYPSDFPLEVLDVMRKRDNVCNYLDIALQHISDSVLGNMRRHISKDETIALIRTIREKVPDIKIRTTLMTGFPGEGNKEFEELKDFVVSQRFERMGAFAYCEEDDTFAALHLRDSIPEKVKQERLDKIMEIQESISLELNEQLVGQTVRVIIDRVDGGKAYGRTQYDSPEVDPEVIMDFIAGISPGDFVNVEIKEAYPFELIGSII